MAMIPEDQVKPVSILLAEDHVIVRESIRQSLERKPNFKVVGEANDGEEAVQMAQYIKPDVIIMDISMPKLNGIEATRRIKANQPSVAILALTAYDYEQYIFPLLAAGAAGYLLKDISSRELINAIETVHKGESVLHPAIARKVLERFKRSGNDSGEEVTKILTEQEITVLKMAAKGMNNKNIADDLSISVRTVESHLASIFAKLGVGSRTEAVIQAMKQGWFTLEELTR
jgi:two-component system, NarL family, response regulator LiaR